MNRQFFSLILLFLLACTNLFAQSRPGNNGMVPYKSAGFPLFGKDIMINNIPSENQMNVSICSAFNGWLYAAYWVKLPEVSNGSMQVDILKSEDSGLHWNLLQTFLTGWPTEIFTSFKIVACGNNLSNLKVFLGMVYYDTLWHSGTAYVPRFDGITGQGEVDILDDQSANTQYLDIASDFNFSALNADPCSFAILYAKGQGNNSLIFRSSSDGGMTLNNTKVVAVSTNQLRFNRVALNFGRSSTYSDGRYFATWQLKSTDNLGFNHIYTSHSEPGITGSFTSPICLDSIDQSLIGQCKNPVIACQFGGYDNDSSNLTEVVLAEKYNALTNNYDIIGFYNRNAATSSTFYRFDLASSDHNEIQPSINFNPYDSTFMVTYYDSTDRKLPFIINKVDFLTPDAWQILCLGYNDSPSLSNPLPTVTLSLADHQGVNSWIGNPTGGLGLALFDSPSSTYTGYSNKHLSPDEKLVRIHPNPCSKILNIDFDLEYSQNVRIELYSLAGQRVLMITNQTYPKGNHNIRIDLSCYQQGSYLCSSKIGNYSSVKKVLLIR
jgi:hypothetical protein